MANNYDDINKTEQVKNILTEAQLAEMVAKGTVPPNEEFFTFDDDEDENLDCLRTEVVYDMNSNEPSLNWGYKTGIKGGNTAIGGKDFSKYQFLIITARQGNASMTSIMDLTILNTISNTYNSGALGCEAADTDYCKFTVNAEKTEFTCNRIGYRTTSGSIVDMYHENAVCMKIVGIIKSPAMIYTGKELHEGNGISIKDGVVSQTVISKATSCVQIPGGQSYTGPNYQTVASFSITTKGGRIFASYCIPLYTSGNVAYTAVYVDGVNYGQEVRMTGTTTRHLSNTVITPELSPGVHTIQLIVRGQKDSNTLTIPSYETGYLLGAEL